jgi:prefoldin subunit 5
MLFKVFKQKGNEIIINLDNIVFINRDSSTKGTIIYSVTHSNVVDESFEEVKKMLGSGPAKEMGY